MNHSAPAPFHLSALEPKHAVQHSFQRPAVVRSNLNEQNRLVRRAGADLSCDARNDVA
jgi:hypothetical protein